MIGLTWLRFTCVAWLIFVCAKARRRWLNFRKLWIIRALIGALRGSTRIGASTIRFRISGWRAASHTREKPRKRKRPFGTSSNCGKTPTPTFLSFNGLRWNTLSCGEGTGLLEFRTVALFFLV